MSRYKFPETIGPKFCKPILPWVELFWHNKKRYPTDGELVEQFGLTLFQIERLHASKYYENCLKARGISRQQSDLTEIQVAAISLITNFSDTRPPEVKMASIGVTPEELNGWYSNSIFQRELAARADSVLDNIFPEAQAQLARQIKKGSFPALKFYYEITGRAQAPEVVNLKMAMQRLVEAVQKHVKDPEVIAAIGMEMQGLTQASSATEVIESHTQPPVAELTFKERYQEHLNERE